MTLNRSAARGWVLVALLAYWALSLHGLDAHPLVREDEPWQAAPGYSFWTRGVYGSELYRDFAHMDQRYYLFPPTFSLLLGLATRLWGLGLFQLRVVSVILGGLTICLTFTVGARLGGRAVGVSAIYLLLLWRWGAGAASGITLLDQARIARYDTLVPVWGLTAWYAFLVARETTYRRDFLVAGAFAGLAGLAHLYGLFWLGVFAVVLLLDFRRLRDVGSLTLLLALGAFITWTPWLLYIGTDWTDFVAQTSNYANRFDVLNARFYLDNLIREPQRYGLGRATLASAVVQPGVWLLVFGLPAALVWLWRRAPAARTLAIAASMLPIAFALLLAIKIPGYLLSIAPLFAIVVACAATAQWRTQRASIRAVVVVAAALLALDGGVGIAQQHRLAADATPYPVFLAQVRAIVPPRARVLAMQQHWLGLGANDFRAYADVFFLTNPNYSPHPLNLEQAFELIAPDIIIVDAILGDVIARGDDPSQRDANAQEFAARYHAYMERHHARELGRVVDQTFGTLIVYEVPP